MVSCAACGLSKTARTKQQGISFHAFPRDDRREMWENFIKKPEKTLKTSIFLCSQHFTKDLIDRTSLAVVRLRSHAVPTVLVSRKKFAREYPDIKSKLTPLSLSNAKTFHSDDGTSDISDRGDFKNSKGEKEVITRGKIEGCPVIIETEIDQSDQNLVENENATEISHQLCRLCLENRPVLWTFFSILTFDDQSTFDVSQAFQHVTGESNEQIEDETLPNHICQQCVDLLIAAYQFREKYERRNRILNEKMKQQIEPCETPREPYSESLEDTVVKIKAETTHENIDIDLDLSDDSETRMTKKVNVLHRCPICLKKFTALRLKQHCKTHQTFKTYLNAAPRFNKTIRFYAMPKTSESSIFYRENITHSCPHCSEEFDGKSFLLHLKQHKKEGNYRCHTCNRIFMGINYLRMHQLSHKKEAVYKCPECGKGFFQKRNFEFHQLIHTRGNDLPFKCTYCDRTFPNPNHLKRHIFNHESPISYQKYYSRNSSYTSCTQCQQKFKSEDESYNHVCRFCCAKCRKIFATKKEFNKHVCKYKLKGFKCQPCGKTFKLSSSQNAHKYRCTYRTLCYVCGKNVSNITLHLRSHFGYNPKRCFTCASCEKKFKYKETLDRHIKQVHLKIISCYCQYCSKGFKSTYNLKVHERIHVGEKNHVCGICGKGFLEKSYLIKHFKVHLSKNHLEMNDV